MLLDLLAGLLIFPVVALGLAWPLAARLTLAPAEKLGASVALSLLGTFLFAWMVYVCALPVAVLRALPLLAAAGLVAGRRSLGAALGDTEARALLATQLIVTAWCVGWLALVASYSGGAWTGDWFGHWDRARFFLERWPRDKLFDGFDPITSRPPLANVVIGALLGLTRTSFAVYQLLTALFGSLAFFPAALLAQRFRPRPCSGGHAVAVLAVLFMLNPLFVQNATFAWTKLPAAFFVLTALYFFLRAHDSDAPPAAGVLCAASLAAGLLAHYSAGPYAVLLALAWLALGWPRRRDQAWRHTTALAALAGGLVLATWFGWSLAVFGARHTLLSNTTVTDQAPTAGAQLIVVALNLRDTLVPHFLRGADFGAFRQSSPWGWWRDWFFQLYQVNFFFAFGSLGWAAILAGLVRTWRGAAARSRGFWAFFISGATVLGVAVHGARDSAGLVHICLQPLVLLGLAFLASRWTTLSFAWQRALVAGLTVDFFLGIALQFAVESYALDHWVNPGRPAGATYLSYSPFAMMNLRAKLQNQWVFLGDVFSPHAALVVVALAALLGLALARAVRTSQPKA